MRLPSVRTRRFVSLSAAPVAVLLAGAMVWQGSNAAFTSDTRNTGNSWELGRIGISDDDGGSAMFSIANAVPMQTGEKCIAVTASTGVPSSIKFYVGQLASDGLEAYVKLTIAQGTGGSFASCAGFTADQTEASQSLASLNTAHSSWATAILPWTTSLGVVKTYKFDWVFDTTGLDEAAVNGLQGKSASINFEWELQNT